MVFVRLWKGYMSHFKNKPNRDGPIYLVVILVAAAYAIVSLIAPLIVSDCNKPHLTKQYPNVEFEYNSCLDDRYPKLLFMTPRECEQFRQLMFSVLMGALIGYERRSPDRAAGIRTMSVTSLGSCAFTIASMYAFRDGPMCWDASRVSAAIPSGVGFLGSGLIWKGMVGEGADQTHQVHGLTTAASVWLSAAIGVLSGGGMFFVSLFAVTCSMIILRFGPRHSEETQEDEEESIKPEDKTWDNTNREHAPGAARNPEQTDNETVTDITFEPNTGEETLHARLLIGRSASAGRSRRSMSKKNVLKTHF